MKMVILLRECLRYVSKNSLKLILIVSNITWCIYKLYDYTLFSKQEGKRNGEFRITASVNGISSIMGDYLDDKLEVGYI